MEKTRTTASNLEQHGLLRLPEETERWGKAIKFANISED